MDPSHRPGLRQGPVLNIISLITPQPGEAINWGHLTLVNTHISSKWETVQCTQYCWDHLKLHSSQTSNQTNNRLILIRRTHLQALSVWFHSPFCLIMVRNSYCVDYPQILCPYAALLDCRLVTRLPLPIIRFQLAMNVVQLTNADWVKTNTCPVFVETMIDLFSAILITWPWISHKF